LNARNGLFEIEKAEALGKTENAEGGHCPKRIFQVDFNCAPNPLKGAKDKHFKVALSPLNRGFRGTVVLLPLL
jgi:hypothetical protein